MDLRALQARLSGNLATVPSRLRGPAAVNMTCQAAYACQPVQQIGLPRRHGCSAKAGLGAPSVGFTEALHGRVVRRAAIADDRPSAFSLHSRNAAHSCIIRRRFSKASPRRYAASTLLSSA